MALRPSAARCAFLVSAWFFFALSATSKLHPQEVLPAHRPAALRRAALMRSCQPGPPSRKWSSTSRSMRSETCSLTPGNDGLVLTGCAGPLARSVGLVVAALNAASAAARGSLGLRAMFDVSWHALPHPVRRRSLHSMRGQHGKGCGQKARIDSARLRVALPGSARGVSLGRARHQGARQDFLVPGRTGRGAARERETAGLVRDGLDAAVHRADRLWPGPRPLDHGALRQTRQAAPRPAAGLDSPELPRGRAEKTRRPGRAQTPYMRMN